MALPEELKPPPEMNKADTGAPEPETSDSEDQFTDAQSNPMTPHMSSPIPRTRVEKVDSDSSHDEAPGTEAHRMRATDAQPDEIAVTNKDMDESLKSFDTSTPRQEVLLTVFESEQSDDQGSSSTASRISEADTDSKPEAILEPANDDENASDNAENNVKEKDDDDFGDDFEDFKEGAYDDDFDDFEEGFQQPQPTQATSQQGPPPSQHSQIPFSIPDYDGLGPDEVLSMTEQCLDSLFPPEKPDFPVPQTLPQESFTFLTPRSASLWSQLVAPPPLAPPDWIRSRTRRLFLVSLGVPVDLDEILPASKQKKLVLPSLNLRATSPRNSSDSRSVSRLRQGEGNASSTSVDSQGKPTVSKKRKGPPPEPELDLVAVRYLCMTTDEALDGMTNEELKQHVSKLETMEGIAKEALEYWRKRTDEKIGDREAFEGVIENLVKHARKVRK